MKTKKTDRLNKASKTSTKQFITTSEKQPNQAVFQAESLKRSKAWPEAPTTTSEQRLALIKAAIKAAGTPPLGGQSDKCDDAIVYVKLSDAATAWTWYIMEFSEISTGGPNMAYGFVNGQYPEYGNFSFEELAAFPNVVVDESFKSQTIGACRQEIKDRA
jgi:hypothetical protein